MDWWQIKQKQNYRIDCLLNIEHFSCFLLAIFDSEAFIQSRVTDSYFTDSHKQSIIFM